MAKPHQVGWCLVLPKVRKNFTNIFANNHIIDIICHKKQGCAGRSEDKNPRGRAKVKIRGA